MMRASPALLAVPLFAGALCALLIVVLMPLLRRYALARPNARSSHTVPTPQGGGIAVVAATIAAAALADALTGSATAPGALFAAAIFIAGVGAWDDLRPIPVLPRLVLQALAVGAVLAALPGEMRVAGFLPLIVERALLLVAGLWFVNLVNFMDGLDWMTVAEIVPVTAALALLGALGVLSREATLVALALGGALIGFAPFNRPVAKLFLGDVGSLSIGLIAGWCLLELAAAGHIAAALLLPLYYLADATLTLLRRLARAEPFWLAHRSHFYQRATDNGFTVRQVVGRVFALNVGLAALAGLTVAMSSPLVDILALVVGCGAVALLLARFARPRG